MILGEHGKAFEHGGLSKGGIQTWGARLTLLAVDLCASKFQRGMSSGKLELPDRVPKPELGNQ